MKICKPSFPSFQPKSFISNDLHILASHLSKALFSPSPEGLKRKLVIIPSNVTKEFLTQQLIQAHGVLLGVRFLSLAQAFDLFAKLYNPKKPTFPSHLPFMFYLEDLIQKMSAEDHPRLLPLKEYLETSEKSAISLATELSHVFLHYTIYGGKALDEWEKADGWQQLLWEKAKEDWELPHLSYKTGFTEEKDPSLSLECHLFDLSHIPKLFQNALDALSTKWSLSYYFLSPSPLFWSDFLHTKERAKLDQIFQKKEVQINERSAFKELMKDNHRLISNWGKLGQKLFEKVSELECIDFFEEPEGSSNLAKLQSDLFAMEKTETFEKDESIVVHKAYSKLHEVELLYKHLHEQIGENQLTSDDIAVLAPDLESYYPFIRYVFHHEKSPFGYRIGDLSITKQNAYMRNLQLLFQVLESRFQPDLIQELFLSTFFAKKHLLDERHIQLLKQVVEHHHIRWGYNQTMRTEILGKSETSVHGNWKSAFSSLLTQIPYLESPYSTSQYETIGEIMELIDQLYEIRTKLLSGNWPLDRWLTEIEGIVEAMLAPSEDANIFFKELLRLNSVSLKAKGPFCYASFQRALREIFATKNESIYVPKDITICFSSLTEGSLPSVKALFILGLDEETFPGKNTYRSLNELKKHPQSDHQPTAGEKDRYTFLKALLMAKNSLILSYVGYSEADGKEIYPSMLIEELIDYLNIDLIQKHPPFLFSSTYFQKENYLLEPYEIALYRKSPPQKEPFSLDSSLEIPIVDEPLAISLGDLSRLVRNPIQLYCNKSLGIYLEEKSVKQKRLMSEFFLSYMDRAMIKRDLMKQKTLSYESLPTALFHDSALFEIKRELQEVEEGLAHFGVPMEAIEEVVFHSSNEQIIGLEAENHYKPISFTLHSLQNQTGFVFGKVDWVCPRGLISLAKPSSKEIWKLLPNLIALSFTQIPTSILFLSSKEEKVFSKEACQTLLEPLILYYLTALKAPSPLLPDWLEVYLKSKELPFEEIMQKKPPRFSDPYLTFTKPNTSESWKKITEPLCNLLTV